MTPFSPLTGPPRACGILNVKLMKCGGIAPARRIAGIALAAEMDLMWGCNDESAVSIAALYAALSCPATRYLDLDGSFDLARDVAQGGFVLEEGMLRTTDTPGLGLRAVWGVGLSDKSDSVSDTGPMDIRSRSVYYSLR